MLLVLRVPEPLWSPSNRTGRLRVQTRLSFLEGDGTLSSLTSGAGPASVGQACVISRSVAGGFWSVRPVSDATGRTDTEGPQLRRTDHVAHVDGQNCKQTSSLWAQKVCRHLSFMANPSPGGARCFVLFWACWGLKLGS